MIVLRQPELGMRMLAEKKTEMSDRDFAQKNRDDVRAQERAEEIGEKRGLKNLPKPLAKPSDWVPPAPGTTHIKPAKRGGMAAKT